MTESHPRKRGKILSFYSYRGGSGRSSAVANIGCLLAHSGKKVLMIDWDLSAPTLHHAFAPLLKDGASDCPHGGRKLETTGGVIDLFEQLKDGTGLDDNETAAEQLVARVNPGRFMLDTAVDGLRLMKAGRFDSDYTFRVNRFRWDELFERSPFLYLEFTEWLSRHFDYVLVDAPAGIGLLSALCTMVLPEKLVLLFPPNRSSIDDGVIMARKALAYRRGSSDHRPLLVVPVPARIETQHGDLLNAARRGANGGFQQVFETMFIEEYRLPAVDLTQHFDQTLLPSVVGLDEATPLAVETGSNLDCEPLLAAYKHLAVLLAGDTLPWQAQA